MKSKNKIVVKFRSGAKIVFSEGKDKSKEYKGSRLEFSWYSIGRNLVSPKIRIKEK